MGFTCYGQVKTIHRNYALVGEHFPPVETPQLTSESCVRGGEHFPSVETPQLRPKS